MSRHFSDLVVVSFVVDLLLPVLPASVPRYSPPFCARQPRPSSRLLSCALALRLLLVLCVLRRVSTQHPHEEPVDRVADTDEGRGRKVSGHRVLDRDRGGRNAPNDEDDDSESHDADPNRRTREHPPEQVPTKLDLVDRGGEDGDEEGEESPEEERDGEGVHDREMAGRAVSGRQRGGARSERCGEW